MAKNNKKGLRKGAAIKAKAGEISSNEFAEINCRFLMYKSISMTFSKDISNVFVRLSQGLVAL